MPICMRKPCGTVYLLYGAEERTELEKKLGVNNRNTGGELLLRRAGASKADPAKRYMRLLRRFIHVPGAKGGVSGD